MGNPYQTTNQNAYKFYGAISLNMKNYSFIAPVIVLLLIAGCATEVPPSKVEVTKATPSAEMPDSFTLVVSADHTSSGASRYYNASIDFRSGRAESGWQEYEVWPNTGDHNTTKCRLAFKERWDPHPTWYDWSLEGPCTIDERISDIIPLNESALDDKIGEGILTSFDGSGRCQHYHTCYKIVK